MSDLSNNQQATSDDQPATTNLEPTVKIGSQPEKEPHREILSTEPQSPEETPELDREVEKAGVREVGGEIKLTPHDRAVGLEAAAEETPVFPQTKGSNFALNEEEVKVALHRKITNSIVWWVTHHLRQLRIIYHRLKE